MARRGLGHAVFLHRTLLPLRRPAGGRGRLDGGPERLGLACQRGAACSIGVYQAYFPLAAALLVLRLLQQCLDSETPWKTVALRALRFVGVLAAAMVVYFLLLHLCLRLYHETLTAYRGINNMGKLNFAELPQMLVRCVRCFYLLPKTGYAFLTNSRLIRWAMWASLLLSAVSLALAWRDRDWKKIVTVVLLLAALPIAANGIFIMAPETATHTLMTYGVVTLFYLPLIVGDGLRWRRDAVRRWVSLLTCLCLAGASAGYAWFCNGCYRTNYYSNEIMASYYTSMLTRARSMEGYTPDLEIVFVGQYVEDPTLCDLWSGTPFIMGGRSTASVQINEYGRLRMIVMSTGMGTRYATDDELAQYADSIAAAPNYPADGCMWIEDGKLFIRLCDPSTVYY